MKEYHVYGAMETPATLGRRITRRLSLVARVPNFIQAKLRADGLGLDVGDIGGNIRRWPHQLRRARPVTINIILPNGVERTVRKPSANRQNVSKVVKNVVFSSSNRQY